MDTSAKIALWYHLTGQGMAPALVEADFFSNSFMYAALLKSQLRSIFYLFAVQNY